MIIKLVAQILFYLVVFAVAIYGLTMIYVLLRYGLSKISALIVSAFYVLIMLSLFAAAVANFHQIPFPSNFSL